MAHGGKGGRYANLSSLVGTLSAPLDPMRAQSGAQQNAAAAFEKPAVHRTERSRNVEQKIAPTAEQRFEHGRLNGSPQRWPRIWSLLLSSLGRTLGDFDERRDFPDQVAVAAIGYGEPSGRETDIRVTAAF